MDDWKLPNYAAARGDPEDAGGADDDETLLAGHDHDDSEDEEKTGESSMLGSRRSMKSSFWMILMTIATLAARRILNSGFPYPYYYVLLIQLGAYTCVVLIVLLAKLKHFRTARRKPEDEKHTWLETIFMGFRTLLSSSIGAVSILCAAQAVLHFPNLPLLAMLPILTYVSDSILFRFAYTIHLLPRGQSTSLRKVYRIVVIVFCACLAIYDDYRLNVHGLSILLASFGLASLAKAVSKAGPKIETKGPQSWETPLQTYLLAGIPPLVLAGVATMKFENIAAASAISQTWTVLYRVMNLGPGVVLQIVFGSSILSAYPFMSQEHVGGALEEVSDQARDAVASTLQAGFWTFVIGVLGNETNFITWTQVIAFTLIYIISIGPKHIAYYPPRFMNLLLRLFRRRPQPIHAEPWQFSVVLISTTIVFAILVSTNTTFWVDTIAYHRNLGTWLGPNKLILDTMYRPPELRSFDVVIAHSAGDSVESIINLVNTYARHYSIGHLAPRVKVYTRDPTFNLSQTSPEYLRGDFEGELSVQTLRNVGGASSSFLHHILYSWDNFPVQTMFLSTHSMTETLLPLLHTRFEEYFVAAGFPIPDALPKTGFLNLGDHETCWCGGCYDISGWEDTFHLVPSMWSAARPESKKCESVLLTYGNNFITTAARIRGIKKEIWQLLYDALVNEDKTNAWAHAPEKIPKKLPGEEGKGRWAKGQIYGEEDSLEKPYLGHTVERLWGILLQCSTGEIAWKCPSLEREYRTGGNKEDCGCIE
ncbi:uncharacterized protein LY89DRAFT_404936 [Mollisia scopiformis]|uniref:Uncharacterized protein n=1 Tax=Mollisia scopiformis TaxID=149040 RepID=A0A132B4Y6_MOLSC|nr:uncharacterized protein LY89DRAFT_404936 [Mollisia scopiformis]KUJ06737.1 hypothetical protein LY89DRAFT_404936 [Mollisia scopiformis]